MWKDGVCLWRKFCDSALEICSSSPIFLHGVYNKVHISKSTHIIFQHDTEVVFSSTRKIIYHFPCQSDLVFSTRIWCVLWRWWERNEWMHSWQCRFHCRLFMWKRNWWWWKWGSFHTFFASMREQWKSK